MNGETSLDSTVWRPSLLRDIKFEVPASTQQIAASRFSGTPLMPWRGKGTAFRPCRDGVLTDDGGGLR